MEESWDRINAVQRMQDYIEARLGEPITLRKLAAAAGYSPWHAARLFRELTGKTPFEYIRSLRLSRAALKLWDEDAKVIDVALDFVFDSHEGFSRAFSKQFGLSPQAYRRSTPPLQLFMPWPVRGRHLIMRKGATTMPEQAKVKTIFTQVVERPARKLILKRGAKAAHYFEYCEEVGCDIWGVLCSIKGALYEPIGLWLPAGLRRPGTSVYAQGVEVPADYSGEIPAGFEIIDLPPCKIMIFQGEPYDDDRFEAEITEVQQAINAYDPAIYGFAWDDEAGPRFQLAPMGYRGYIEARPVRQLNA